MMREIGLKMDSKKIQDLQKSIKRAKQRDIYDYMVKIIIVGDSGVGKTNIISRFCAKEGEVGFKDYHVATIGVDFTTKIIQLQNSRLKLQIWDTAGQERFKTITQTYYKGAAGIILAYSVDCQESFINIQSWIEQVNLRTTQSVKKILVANKIDVEDQYNEEFCTDQPRKISRERGIALANKCKMEYYQVSAKSNQGVNEMFASLSNQINESIRKSTIKNQSEEMDVTITLNSNNARHLKKVRNMGLQYKVEQQKSIIIKYKQKICNC